MNTNFIDRSKTCCFTGPRAHKLPWKYKEFGLRYLFFKYRLKKSIIRAINDGYILFISGMALGFDLIAAEIVIDLKKRYPHIQLECAIPCIDQYFKWSEENIMRHRNICKMADYVTYVSDIHYFNGCMAKRNQYMIEKSSRIIACKYFSEGGTKQTIKMAENENLEIIIINLYTS